MLKYGAWIIATLSLAGVAGAQQASRATDQSADTVTQTNQPSALYMVDGVMVFYSEPDKAPPRIESDSPLFVIDGQIVSPVRRTEDAKPSSGPAPQ